MKPTEALKIMLKKLTLEEVLKLTKTKTGMPMFDARAKDVRKVALKMRRAA